MQHGSNNMGLSRQVTSRGRGEREWVRRKGWAEPSGPSQVRWSAVDFGDADLSWPSMMAFALEHYSRKPKWKK